MNLDDFTRQYRTLKSRAGGNPPEENNAGGRSREQGFMDSFKRAYRARFENGQDLNAPNMRTPFMPGEYNFQEDKASRNWDARMAGNMDMVRASIQRAKIEQVGQPGFWQNPSSIVRWRNALEAGQEAPAWLRGHEADVDLIYRYMQERNGNKPPQEWKFLNINDPMVGALSELPTPPSEMMTRRERETFAAPEAVKAGTAMWGDMAPDVRAAVLSDPEFYKGGITEYSLANQQAILADPNFDWEQLPDWQKAYYGLSSNPAGMGVVQGALMGLGGGAKGSFVGAMLGAGLGAFAGWSGYDQTREAWQQGDGVWTWDLNQVKDVGKGAFGWLNFLAEQAEKGIGMGLQIADAALDPNVKVKDVMTRAGWDAGATTFEVLTPAVQAAMQADGKLALNDALQLVPTLHIMERLGDLILHPEKYKGEELILGSNVPVKLDRTFQERIADARERIANGENYRAVMTEMQNGIMAQIGDMAGQAIADPLNVLPRAQAEVVSRVAEAGGHEVAAAAFKGQRDLLQGAAQYKADVLANRVPESFRYNEMSGLARFVSGVHVDEAGIPRRRAGMFSDKSILDMTRPQNKIARTLDYFATLTPEARARTGINLTSENMLAMMTMFDNAEDFTAFFDRVAGGDLEQAREMGARFAESPEFYTILPAMKGFDMESQLALWRSTEPARARMYQIAEALGMERVFDLRDELGRPGGAERIWKRLEQLDRGEGAAALLADAIGNGDLTAEGVAKLGEIFSKSEMGAPLSYQEWSAVTANAVTHHFAEWSVQHFGIKPGKFINRLADTLKRAQSVLLLGFNPAYALNNGINNVVTRAAAGNFGYMSPKHINEFIARLGIEPSRMGEGVGMFGDALRQTDAGSPESVIMQATSTQGALARADGVLKWVGDKTGAFNKLSGWFESIESKQAYAIGIKRAWENIWREGKGLRRMPKELADAIDAQLPGGSQIIREAVASGMNMAEVEAAVGRGELALRARNLVDETAREMGMDPAAAGEMLSQLGLNDALDSYLSGAKDERRVRAAFEAVRRRAQDMVDVKLADEHQGQVEHTANRIKTEGHRAVVDVFADAQITILERWLGQYGEYGDVFQDIYALDDRPDLQHALLSEAYEKSNREWRRTNTFIYGIYEALVKGMGIENMPEARSLLAKIAEVHEAWREAFDLRKAEHDKAGKPSERLNLQDDVKRRESFARVDQVMEETFKRAAKIEREIGREITDLIEAQYGQAAGDAARKMWVELADFREEMVRTLQEKRAAFLEMPSKERRAAKAKFYRDEYPALIEQLQYRKVNSAIELDRIISGRGGQMDLPTPDAPQAPETPNAPAGGRIMQGGQETQGQGIIGRNDAPAEQVAAYFDDSPDPAQAAHDADVYAIANEYGVPSAKADGSIDAGAQVHILNIVKKYGGEDAALTFADLTADQTRAAFAAREAAHNQQMPLGVSDETRLTAASLRDPDIVESVKTLSEALPEPDAETTRASEEAAAALSAEAGGGDADLTKRIMDTHIADLPEAMRDGLIYKFSEMRDLVAGGEPGQRIFNESGFSHAVASTYPEWYGPLKQKKEMVVFALDALRHGQDRPGLKLYENLKAIALDDLLGDKVMLEKWDWAQAFGVEEPILTNWELALQKIERKIDGVNAYDTFAAEQLPADALVKMIQDLPDEALNAPRRYGEGTLRDYWSEVFDASEAKAQEIRETHAVARGMAQAQAQAERMQAYRDTVMTREILREQAVEKFGLTSEQAEAAMTVWEGMADYWSRDTGRPASEFYAQALAGVERGIKGLEDKAYFQEDYWGGHRPPGPDGGAPLHDVTGGGDIYPDDIYGPHGAQYYGHGGSDKAIDAKTIEIFRKYRNKPEALVTVYRAIPDDINPTSLIAKYEDHKRYIMKHGEIPPGVDTSRFSDSSAYYDFIYDEINRLKNAEPVNTEIKSGDWITVNRQYAVQHGEGALNGNYEIITKRVKAREIFTNGDSIHEFGYYENGVVPDKIDVDNILYQRDTSRIDPVNRALSGAEVEGYARALARTNADEIRRAVAGESSKQARVALLDEIHKLAPELAEDAALQVRDILFQDAEAGRLGEAQPKAGVSFGEDGRAVLHAFEQADLSSFMHESGHVFRRMLNENDLRVAEEWAGVRDGVWAREHEEKFARSFERYLAEGNAPTPKMARVFAQFKTWLLDIYKRIAGSPIDIEIPAEMKALFDRMLSEEVGGVELGSGELGVGGGTAYAPGDIVRVTDASGAKTQVTVREARANGDLVLDNGTVRSAAAVERVAGQENMFGEMGMQAGPAEQQVTLFQEALREMKDANAPQWYSRLAQVVEGMPQEKMPARQFEAWVKKQSGIKADELKWTGFDDWLAEQDGVVTREEASAYLRENKVSVEERILNNMNDLEAQVEERMRSDISSDTDYWADDITRKKNEILESAKIEVTGKDDWGDDLFSVEYKGWKANGLDDVTDVYEVIDALGIADDDILDMLQEEDWFDDFVDEYVRDNLSDNVSAALQEFNDRNYHPLYEIHDDRVRYKYYQLPGGENYKELLFYVPGVEGFDSKHFDTAGEDLLAHTRFNERIDSNGNRVLFVEEVQSDWHQQGRDRGYETRGPLRAIPDAPFAKTWHELVMKRMLRYAAENGFDSVAWTTGEQQAARYNLAKHVDKLSYNGENLQGHKNNRIIFSENINEDALPAAIGKEAARKLLESEPTETGTRHIEGDDLAVGGEGMKSFYNRTLPHYMDKYGKKWGAKVGVIELEGGTQQLALPITPEMKRSVLREGQVLFQEADPRMPSGGYENVAGVMFDGETMAEGWDKFVEPLLAGMEDTALARVTEASLSAGEGTPPLDADTQRQLQRYLNQVKGDMATSKLAAVRFGETLRDQAMLNYSNKYGIDRSAELIFPYQFWYTRSMLNWGLRALTKPAWYANYARMQQMQNRYVNNLPERLRGKVQISAPWMPEWMGQTLYVDPMKQIFPFANFASPLEQMRRDNNYQVVEAERILQEWIADGRVSEATAQQAAMQRSGELWKQAMAESAVRREKEISNPLDFIGSMFGPAWYLTTPAKALGLDIPMLNSKGEGAQSIGETPMLKTARAFETVTRGTWAEPVGQFIGLLGKPEEWARNRFEIPEYGEYGEYYVKRQVANMVADGLISADEAKLAMIEQKGEVWNQARERVDMEMAMRIPLAGATYAGLHAGAGAGLAALPASLLGSGLLPAGELAYRGMKDEWDAAWKEYDAGNTEAIRDFFDANPEYEAYLAKGKSGEEQLRSYLVGVIWDQYMNLGTTQRKQAGAELPALFKQAFLDNETRSYESIPIEDLTAWAQMLGGMTPESAAGVDADVSAQLAAAAQSPAAEIDWYAKEITDVTDAFSQQRAEKFPYYYAQQKMYFALPYSERAAWLRRNPELKAYWDWKDGWNEAYPELKDWFNGRVYKRIDTSGWSPALLYYVQDYALTGEELPDGALSLLNQLWVREGQPYGSLEAWVSASVAPSVLNEMAR